MTYGNKALSEEQEENEYTLYINNYRSLRTGDEDEYIQIRLGKITVLMGQRGSGKSSIMEAIHLLNTAYTYKKQIECNENNESEYSGENYLSRILAVTSDPGNPPLKSETDELIYCVGKKPVKFKSSKILNLAPKPTYLYDLINKFEKKAILLFRSGYSFFGISLEKTMEPGKININELEDKEEVMRISNVGIDKEQNVKIGEFTNPFVTYVSTVNRLNPFKLESDLFQQQLSSALGSLVVDGIGPFGNRLEQTIELISNRFGLPYEKLLDEIYTSFMNAYNRVLELEDAPYRLEDIKFNSLRKEVIFNYLTLNEEKIYIPLSQLSKGTLNLLSIILQTVLADIFSKKYDTDYIIMIEEPEVTLHSSSLQALTNYIIDNNNPHLKFLLTSHSFRLIAALHTSIKTNNLQDIIGPYRIYILSKRRNLTTKVTEYDLLDTGELIASSMESLSIEELKTIHKVMSLGGPFE